MGLPTVIIYATLAACGLVIAMVVRRYDLHAREPVWALAVATLLGAGGMHLAGLVQIALIRSVNASGALVTNTSLAIMAGITEELAKFAAAGAMILFARRHFDEAADGVIYGAFAGLGAALEEAVSMLGFDRTTLFLPLQEPVRLAGHLVMGGIGGFGWGLVVIRARHRLRWMLACLAGAMILHTLWDIVAFEAADYHRLARRVLFWHTASPIGLMLAGLVAFRGLVARGEALDSAAHRAKLQAAPSPV